MSDLALLCEGSISEAMIGQLNIHKETSWLSQVRVTAQSQDEGLIALPKQFFLGFASTLGITKDITRTQAYSVWLQGERTPHQHSAQEMHHSVSYLRYTGDTQGMPYAARCKLLVCKRI